MTDTHQAAERPETTGRNLLILLLLLILPAAITAAILYLWPDTTSSNRIGHTAIGVLGAFASALLSVFVIVRYRSRAGIAFAGGGLLTVGIMGGLQALTLPGTSASAWLHYTAAIIGIACFSAYALSSTRRHDPRLALAMARRAGWFLGGAAALALLLGLAVLALSSRLPQLAYGYATTYGYGATSWAPHAMPALLLLVVGVFLVRQYRRTGAPQLLLFSAIVIFLFQTCLVFTFAPPWGVIWWFWQALRLAVYLGVLGLVLRGYMRMSDSLAVEAEERKKTEAALGAVQRDWQSYVNAMEETILLIGRDLVVENVNASGLGLLERQRDEIVGERCYETIFGCEAPCRPCPLRASLESRHAESEQRYVARYGKYLSMKSAPVLGERGEVVKCVYSISDVTAQVGVAEERRKIQHELHLTSRLASIGKVAAGIAHEINNPLTGVIAFAQMLMQMDVPESMREAVEVINDGANRVVGIVDKLLTFARRGGMDKESADINDILTTTLAMRSYELRTNGIETTLRLDPDLPRTVANIGQLQQVFLNIIVNAEQAMATAQRRGELTIATAAVGDVIRVSIADNGPGIPEEIMDKLFDPFFSTRDDAGGTGLGLSISYGIIEEHAGRIGVDGVPGEGATFHIELPVVAPQGEPIPADAAAPDPVDVGARRIMVVDDEPHICRALDRILTREGHSVEAISDPHAALDRLRRNRYDLILLDLKMPRMSGIEFYDRAKDIDPSVQHRVICVTGDVVSDAHRDFLESTGVPCVAKPFSVDDLLHLLRTVLEGEERCASPVY